MLFYIGFLFAAERVWIQRDDDCAGRGNLSFVKRIHSRGPKVEEEGSYPSPIRVAEKIVYSTGPPQIPTSVLTNRVRGAIITAKEEKGSDGKE